MVGDHILCIGSTLPKTIFPFCLGPFPLPFPLSPFWPLIDPLGLQYPGTRPCPWDFPCHGVDFRAHVRIFVIAHGGVSFFLARNSTSDAGLVFSISGILRDPVAYVLLHFIWAYVYQGLRFDVVDQGLRAHSVILSGQLCHLKRGRIQLVNVLHVFRVSNLVRV